MTVYLSECYDRLPGPEVKRLQKLLGVLMPATADRAGMKRTLLSVYRRLGAPREVLGYDPESCNDLPLQKSPEYIQKSEVIEKLLSSFGIINTEGLEEAEIAELNSHPYTIWTGEKICTISGEALEILAEDPFFRKQGFLFAHLSSLSSKERKSWARWLNIENFSGPEQIRLQKLYQGIAGLQAASEAELPEKPPEYLDEIFPDDPKSTPVAWFYRDVLPFYAALGDCLSQNKSQDKKDRQYNLSPEQENYINLFKSGRLIIRPETPEFGQKNRYRVIASREKSELSRLHSETLISPKDEVRENLLF